MDNPKFTLAQKTAVVFSKTGPAIYHSHHDMIRFWERAAKRADLPLRLTQGFNPRPRIIFPHALGLGIASLHEEVELELHALVDSDTLFQKINAAAGDTLGILATVDLPPVKKSRQIVESSYAISGWPSDSLSNLEAQAKALLDQSEIVVERGAPGKRRSSDIRPYIHSLTGTVDNNNPVLNLVLTHSTTGSARPDEIVSIIAQNLGVDKGGLAILKTGMVLV